MRAQIRRTAGALLLAGAAIVFSLNSNHGYKPAASNRLHSALPVVEERASNAYPQSDVKNDDGVDQFFQQFLVSLVLRRTSYVEYNYFPNGNLEEKNRIFIEFFSFTNIELVDESILAKLRQLHNFHELFERFCQEPRFYVSWRGGGGSYKPEQISIPLVSIFSPEYLNEHLVIAFHELSHGLFDSMSRPAALWRAHRNLYEAQPRLRLFDDTSFDPMEKESQSIYFAIFDESTYISHYGERASRFGHPYDRSNELFASSLTVFRFFPAEFIENYNQLKGIQRRVTRAAALAVLDAVKEFAKNNQDVVALLPEYETLRRALRQ